MQSPQPKFRDPPLIETVMGVHFRPLPRLSSAHQSIFWDRHLRPEFPELEERSTVDEPTVLFGDELVSSVGKTAVRWSVSQTTPIRLWLKSGDEHIVQIQRGALLANWLREPRDGKYIHYPERQAAYGKLLRQFAAFIDEEDLGKLEPTLWTMRYINHVPFKDHEDVAIAFERVFPMWRNAASDDWLSLADTVHLQFGFPMPERQGRLDIDAFPTRRKNDQTLGIRLDLNARGAPQEKTIESAMQGLDLGHDWIVRGFASITTPQMHEAWGRVQ